MATISSAATISVESVNPEMGLFEEPIIPTRLPETAAKKKPSTSMTTAATIPPGERAREVEIEHDHADQRDGQSAEHELGAQIEVQAAGGLGLRLAFFRSEMARLIPMPRLLRILKSV